MLAELLRDFFAHAMDQVVEEVRAVVREELDGRQRLYSTQEIATYLGWSLDRWWEACRSDVVLHGLAIDRGGGLGYGWPLGQVLDRLRATGRRPRRGGTQK